VTQVEAFGRTDCGPVRENNEDALMLDPEAGVFVVADGMGGHAAGEVASSMAVRVLHETLAGAVDPDETRLVRDVSASDPSDIMRERLRYALNQASVQIRRAADARPELRGMGTTAVVLVIDGERAHLAHVGDSRAYLFRGGQLERLTRDHSVVQNEIDQGRLTPEQARRLPHRNILYQSVGFHGPVEPDTTTRPLQPGDLFVLCTDGLTDVLDDASLEALLRQRADARDDLADVLVEAALDSGAEDNVTVVCVTWR